MNCPLCNKQATSYEEMFARLKSETGDINIRLCDCAEIWYCPSKSIYTIGTPFSANSVEYTEELMNKLKTMKAFW